MSKVQKEQERAKQIRKSLHKTLEIGFRKQPKHPLTLEAHMHDECPHLECLAKEKEIQVAIQTCF